MEMGHQPILSRIAQFDAWTLRKRKTFRALLQPQKVLVVELICLPYPMRRAPNVGAVLTTSPDHKGRW